MENNGKLTAHFLKEVAGEFDLEVIFKLDLSNYGISDLGNIGGCANIEWVDLSCNELTRLYGLASLTKLVHLDLSCNRIQSLEGLQTLESLEYLNVAGNQISSVDELSWLAGLEHLKCLRLQDKKNDLKNPICMSPTYEEDIAEMLPELMQLDSWRLKGAGSEIHEMCCDLDRRVRSLKSDSSKRNEIPKFELENFWKASHQFEDMGRAEDAEEQLRLLLNECRTLLKQ